MLQALPILPPPVAAETPPLAELLPLPALLAAQGLPAAGHVGLLETAPRLARRLSAPAIATPMAFAATRPLLGALRDARDRGDVQAYDQVGTVLSTAASTATVVDLLGVAGAMRGTVDRMDRALLGKHAMALVGGLLAVKWVIDANRPPTGITE